VQSKVALWQELLQLQQQQGGSRWCILSDFNAIRRTIERKGASQEANRTNIIAFNDFILQARLIDLPVFGTKYTWYRPDDV